MASSYRRLPSLTGMRFVAAFLVFTSHVLAAGYFSPEATQRLLRYMFGAGWVGVEFFFILSGFVLAWSHQSQPDDTLNIRSPRSLAEFWRRRIVKIFPNHVVTWFAAIGLAWAAGEVISGARIWPSLFLVHTWIPNLTVIASINVPSWSLSCEALFYLSFPLLYVLVKKIRAKHLWWWASGIILVIMLLPVVAYYGVSANPALPGQEMSLRQNWLLVSFPPTRTLDFLLGIVLARLVATGRKMPLRLPAASGLLAVGFAVELLLVPTVFGLTLPVVAPLALVIVAAATADLQGSPSPVRGRTMIWLGEISFAFYLIHDLVLHYVHEATKTWVSQSVSVAIAVAFGLLLITVALSWGLYRLVELPAMRHWSRPRKSRDGNVLGGATQGRERNEESPRGLPRPRISDADRNR